MISRRPRARVDQGKTGQDRWLVSYADLVTLLFGFFVVMYSVSHVSEQKYRALTDTLRSTFSGQASERADEAAPPSLAAAPESEARPAWEGQLQQLVSPSSDENGLTVQVGDTWIAVEIGAQLLFPSGSAEPSQKARELVQQIAAAIAPAGQPIEVEGHTDDLPINTAKFASNWELSAARAAAVARLLADAGVAPERLAAVGYGEFRPVAANDTEANRGHNRRVVIKLPRGASTEAGPTAVPEPAATAEQGKPPTPADESLKPLRLQHGGLLFTNNPNDERKVEQPPESDEH